MRHLAQPVGRGGKLWIGLSGPGPPFAFGSGPQAVLPHQAGNATARTRGARAIEFEFDARRSINAAASFKCLTDQRFPFLVTQPARALAEFPTAPPIFLVTLCFCKILRLAVMFAFTQPA